MNKKRRFGIPNHLKQGLSDTISLVESHEGIYTNTVIPLDRIELDPENPRKLVIKRSDLPHGPNSADPQYQDKSSEYERLCELAESIKSEGIIHPIVVFKKGEKYQVVAGERRCLASIIALKKNIEARVFNEKPTGYRLRLIQWIENNEREDLILYQRLININEIIREYKKEQGEILITASVLAEITKLSRPQATNYLAVINSPQDLIQMIQEGRINNLDKAAVIAKIKNPVLRQEAIELCLSGQSLTKLRELAAFRANVNTVDGALNKAKKKKPGRVASRIHMGFTEKPKVVKLIVDAILAKSEFSQYAGFFDSINWSEYSQATHAFKQLITVLEKISE